MKDNSIKIYPVFGVQFTVSYPEQAEYLCRIEEEQFIQWESPYFPLSNDYFNWFSFLNEAFKNTLPNNILIDLNNVSSSSIVLKKDWFKDKDNRPAVKMFFTTDDLEPKKNKYALLQEIKELLPEKFTKAKYIAPEKKRSKTLTFGKEYDIIYNPHLRGCDKETEEDAGLIRFAIIDDSGKRRLFRWTATWFWEFLN